MLSRGYHDLVARVCEDEVREVQGCSEPAPDDQVMTEGALVAYDGLLRHSFYCQFQPEVSELEHLEGRLEVCEVSLLVPKKIRPSCVEMRVLPC